MNKEQKITDTFVRKQQEEIDRLQIHIKVLEKRYIYIIEGNLKRLDMREQKILKMRLGIDCNKKYTIKEIGHEFGVTMERIRQIEAKAIERIRSCKFKTILDNK